MQCLRRAPSLLLPARLRFPGAPRKPSADPPICDICLPSLPAVPGTRCRKRAGQRGPVLVRAVRRCLTPLSSLWPRGSGINTGWPLTLLPCVCGPDLGLRSPPRLFFILGKWGECSVPGTPGRGGKHRQKSGKSRRPLGGPPVRRAPPRDWPGNRGDCGGGKQVRRWLAGESVSSAARARLQGTAQRQHHGTVGSGPDRPWNAHATHRPPACLRRGGRRVTRGPRRRYHEVIWADAARAKTRQSFARAAPRREGSGLI